MMRSVINTQARTQRERRAFTVVELLIAITVLLLISVGLSVIFGGIGDAVSDGRRNSELNRAAARIESQIRADLDRMSRDGFLVIANRYATDDAGRVLGRSGSADPQGIRLSLRDTDGRPRRADELMFFARGDFKSVRQPISSGVTADAGEAAIYYGIGQKRRPNFTQGVDSFSTNFFFNPNPADTNIDADALLGMPDATSGANPNRFARDWSLLRQVTLLAEPQPVRIVPPEVFGQERRNTTEINLLYDSSRQIGLQPAARTIFNSIAWTDPRRLTRTPGSLVIARPEPNIWWIGDAGRYPGASNQLRSRPFYRSSGVVDIAQGSISEIRRQVLSLATSATPAVYSIPGRANYASDADLFAAQWRRDPILPDGTATPAGGPWHADAASLNLTSDSSELRAWALDMMPSIWDTRDLNAPRFVAGVRYEDLPPRLVYREGPPGLFPETDEGRLARAVSEANQEMLGSQVFVPRCSEFIVEWSYGFVDNRRTAGQPDFKQLIWYGLPRATADLNNDGRIDEDDHQGNTSVRRYDARPGPAQPAGFDDPDRLHVAMERLTTTDPFTPEFAVFGVIDPVGTANPDNDIVTPWPKFIRVTMSLADPTDETLERTYQFVFAVPNGPA
jgi:type II secretory pathway pseudopilin PulG